MAKLSKEQNFSEATDKNKSIKINYKSTIALGFKMMGQLFLSFLLCLIFFSILIFTDNLVWGIIAQILELVIIFNFAYMYMWYEGDRDRNLVNFNHIKYDKLRGLKAGLISSIPLFISYAVLVISFFTQNQILYTIYRILNIPFLNLIGLLTNYTYGFTAYITDIRWYHVIMLLIIPLFTTAPSVIGYLFGYKRISILEKLQFSKSSKK